MNTLGRKEEQVVEVINNSLSRQEADEIVDRSLNREEPYMSMAQMLAHANQFREEKKHCLAE